MTQHRMPKYFLLLMLLFSALTLMVAAIMTPSRASAQKPAAPAAQSQDPEAPLTSTNLIINEVWRSSNLTSEYFELYNKSVTATIDLTSYVIYNNDVNPVGINYLSRLPANLRLIGPQRYLAISATQLGTTTLVGDGLAGSDYLALVNTASDTVVDLVNWGNFPSPGWNNYYLFQNFFFRSNIPTMPPPDGSNSLSRFPDAQDTDTGLDWQSLLASPGFPNQTSTPTPGTATPIAGCEDRYEPDDIMAQAKPLEQNTEQVHTLCVSNGATKDRDWFQMNGVGGKVYTMLTKDLTGPVDTIITLFDSAGRTLAENDDYTPGQSLASRIDFAFPSNGVYYLQVRDRRSNGGLGYQYTVSFTTQGALAPTTTPTTTPTIPAGATATPGPCYDDYEPDGVAETAKLILIGTTQHHSVCPTADADWVRFFARAGKVYTIRTGNLGPGLDSFMYLFDGDGSSILAQNDDGGDGVASRIDFYPQRDGWYFIQVKNAGDIGGSDESYDLSLAVVPGAPQPPGTATALIAPPVTTTPIPATKPPEATKPPVPTPTQAAIVPTPSPRPTTAAEVEAATGNQEAPAAPPAIEVAPSNSETVADANLPNVPNTGRPPLANADIRKAAPKPAQPSSGKYASVLFQIFYDANRNEKFSANEGIRGIQVLFLNSDASMVKTGEIVTSGAGSGQLQLLIARERVYIPYLGINMELSKFPEREVHSLWLKPVNLPDRVP